MGRLCFPARVGSIGQVFQKRFCLLGQRLDNIALFDPYKSKMASFHVSGASANRGAKALRVVLRTNKSCEKSIAAAFDIVRVDIRAVCEDAIKGSKRLYVAGTGAEDQGRAHFSVIVNG